MATFGPSSLSTSMRAVRIVLFLNLRSIYVFYIFEVEGFLFVQIWTENGVLGRGVFAVWSLIPIVNEIGAFHEQGSLFHFIMNLDSVLEYDFIIFALFAVG